MTTLFTANWESNDWSEWDSTTGTTPMIVEAAAALGGSMYGVRSQQNAIGVTNAFQNLGNFSGFSEYTLQFRVDPQDFVVSGGGLRALFSIYDVSPNSRMDVRIRDETGSNDVWIEAGVVDDLGTLRTVGSFATTAVTTDTKVTIRVKKASTDVAADGEIELYLNGVSKASRADVDIFDLWSSGDPMELRCLGVNGDSNTKYYIDSLKFDSGFPGFGTYELIHSAGGIPGSII